MDQRTDTIDSPMLTAALEYARRGWSVFPAPASGEKKSLKSAEHSGGAKWGMTADEAQIRKDVKKWPDANIGIVTGAVSGAFVIETDTAIGHSIDGAAELEKLEEANGKLPETLMAQSPTGSVHRFFNHPGHGIKVWNSDNYIAPGVDCRGDDGMVIGVPSVRPDRPGKHGGVYSWINEGCAISDCPQWLLDIVCRQKQKTRKDQAEQFSYEGNRRPRDADDDPKADLKADPDLVVAALAVIPNDTVDWERWNNIGMAAWCASDGNARVFAAFDLWSQKFTSKYDKAKTAQKWNAYFTSPPTSIGAGTLFRLARDADPTWRQAYDTNRKNAETIDEDRSNSVGVTLKDFYAFMPTHDYVFTPSREMWPAVSVNSRIPPVVLLDSNGKPMLDENEDEILIKPSLWLDEHRSVEMMTWAPGEPLQIRDRLISEGGWIMRKGVSTLNLYRPPMVKLGDAAQAGRWLELLHGIYPDDADHIKLFMAHRVQKAVDKINHALLLGGKPGIGKDTILEPLKYAVGPWNFKEVSPQEMMGSYNDYMKAVVLRISEARDLGDVNRFAFYDHMKTVLATPPDVMRVHAKYTPHHYVFNVAGVLYTTNYKTNGIYLPADDRRSYVAWSEYDPTNIEAGYFLAFYDWLEHQNGLQHVAAYLMEHDISKFDPKASPKKTEAFWAIVDANTAPEQSELADVLDEMSVHAFGKKGQINATTIAIVTAKAPDGYFKEWLIDRKNRRAIPHRFEQCGFVPLRSGTDDGLWVINNRRQAIYVRSSLSVEAQRFAARALILKSQGEMAGSVKTDPREPE